MKMFLCLLLLIGINGCSESGAEDQKNADDVPARPASTAPKAPIKPEASAIIEMLKQEFGPKAVQAVRVEVDNAGDGIRISLRGEVPSEEVKQGVAREVGSRVEGIRMQDFDLQVSGVVPLRRIVEMDKEQEMVTGKKIIFTPDLHFAAAFDSPGWGGDDTIAIWDLATDTRLNRLNMRQYDHFKCMAFSPDGKTLAIGHDHDALTLWSMPLCREPSVLAKAKDESVSNDVLTVNFAPDSKTLVSAHQEKGEIWWWDLGPTHKARLLTTLPAQQLSYFLVFSPDGKTLAAASDREEEIGLFDVDSGARRGGLKGPRMYLEAMAWSPDGKTLAVGRTIDTSGLILFDIASGQAHTLPITETGSIHGIAFSPDSKTLVAKQDGVGLVLWELPAGHEWTRLEKKKVGTGIGLAFSSDGDTLAVACEQMEPYGTGPAGVQLWDVSARPGAVRAATKAAVASQPIAARDDYLEVRIIAKIRSTMGPEMSRNIKAEVLPDGSVRLTGQVGHDETISSSEGVAAIDFAIEGKKSRTHRKVINELVVRPE